MKFQLLIIFTLIFSLSIFAQSTEEKNSKKLLQEIPGSKIVFEMQFIPGGTFKMGSPIEMKGREDDEGPQFEVKVDSFWMGIYEVRFEEFNIFREKELDIVPVNNPDWNADAVTRPSTPYEDPTFGMGKDGFPAASMTQFAALQYCKWLSEKTGIFYRLPTEAEWEYACLGGESANEIATDNSEIIDDLAWHYENSKEKYHPVGEKQANNFALYDMLGNVSEWTLDQYKKNAYELMKGKEAPANNPWMKPTSLHPRTVRGGSYDDEIEEQRCSARMKSNLKWKERDPQIPKSFWWNTDSPFVGFRLVRPHAQPSKEEQMAFWALVFGD